MISRNFVLTFSFLVFSAQQAAAQSTAPEQPAVVPQQPWLAPAATQEMENWRAVMLQVPVPPRAGCFHAVLPDTTWEEIPCGDQTPVPHNYGDYSIQALPVGQPIGQALGSFISVRGVTSEHDSLTGLSNNYSIQLNTNVFNTAACGGNPNCVGWQQFVYTSGLSVTIAYWLLGYGYPCPPNQGYMPDGLGNCWTELGYFGAPTWPITDLQQLWISAYANYNGTGLDVLTFGSPAPEIVVSESTSILGLGTGGWNHAEFNVFGWGSGSQAVFNRWSWIEIQDAILDGQVEAPACPDISFTKETNNLNLHLGLCVPVGGFGPSITFEESLP